VGWRGGQRCGEEQNEGREDFCWVHLG
jgi:hypothetical protein